MNAERRSQPTAMAKTASPAAVQDAIKTPTIRRVPIRSHGSPCDHATATR
jgi:hypothetical protein